MAFEVLMPQLGLTMEEGTVAQCRECILLLHHMSSRDLLDLSVNGFVVEQNMHHRTVEYANDQVIQHSPKQKNYERHGIIGGKTQSFYDYRADNVGCGYDDGGFDPRVNFDFIKKPWHSSRDQADCRCTKSY